MRNGDSLFNPLRRFRWKFNVVLCSDKKEMVEAWRAEFLDYKEVVIVLGDIFNQKADAVVSPGNSFGHMDAGLDKLMCDHFGGNIEVELQNSIINEHYGELLVGQAVLLETGDDNIPYFISTPTMRVPMRLNNSVNPYLATRAVFVKICDYNLSCRKISSVVMSSMCTGTGRMPYDIVAYQMCKAYEAIILGKAKIPKDWKQARFFHNWMISK